MSDVIKTKHQDVLSIQKIVLVKGDVELTVAGSMTAKVEVRIGGEMAFHIIWEEDGDVTVKLLGDWRTHPLETA